jgi:hypothetical protein
MALDVGCARNLSGAIEGEADVAWTTGVRRGRPLRKPPVLAHARAHQDADARRFDSFVTPGRVDEDVAILIPHSPLTVPDVHLSRFRFFMEEFRSRRTRLQEWCHDRLPSHHPAQRGGPSMAVETIRTSRWITRGTA